MPERAPILVERLGDETIDECVALAVDREWAPERDKWLFIFDTGEVWGVRSDDGELVGTVTVTRFGDIVAIGMVLVARSAERQGIGAALMRHVLQQHHDAVHILNATPFGRPLYEKLGFVAVGTTHTHRGIFVPDAARDALLPDTRPATPADLPALSTFDAQVFGADREPLLRALLTSFARKAVIVQGRDGEPVAFGACWSNPDYEQVGPLLGHTDEQIEAVIATLADDVEGSFRVDLNDRDVAVREWATAHGLLETNTSTLMVYGADAFPGDRRRWYAALMQAVG